MSHLPPLLCGLAICNDDKILTQDPHFSYGEMGYMIIFHMVHNLFPLLSIPSDRIDPLTASAFVQRVLVPEVVLSLICQDKGLKRFSEHDEALALTTMRESSAYGVAMFPAPEDPGLDCVSDKIIRERARLRRLEIEQEEKVGNIEGTSCVVTQHPTSISTPPSTPCLPYPPAVTEESTCHKSYSNAVTAAKKPDPRSGDNVGEGKPTTRRSDFRFYGQE